MINGAREFEVDMAGISQFKSATHRYNPFNRNNCGKLSIGGVSR
jgi:hypothetical protein